MTIKDLTGMRFGRLTVLRRAEDDGSGRPRWLCRCDCGELCVAAGRNLRSGNTKSCGCARKDGSRSRRDLTGMRFGRLTALCPVEGERHNRTAGAIWRCRCDCGQETEVSAACLLSGRTRSCGCLNREQMARMHEHMHYENDTCLEQLARAQTDRGTNKAGFRGLFWTRDGRYRVTINFRKKRYNLGYFRDYDEAVQARLDAEQTLHQGYIDARSAYRRRAEADPAWAEKNPFIYNVQRIDGAFYVTTNGTARSFDERRTRPDAAALR